MQYNDTSNACWIELYKISDDAANNSTISFSPECHPAENVRAITFCTNFNMASGPFKLKKCNKLNHLFVSSSRVCTHFTLFYVICIMPATKCVLFWHNKGTNIYTYTHLFTYTLHTYRWTSHWISPSWFSPDNLSPPL